MDWLQLQKSMEAIGWISSNRSDNLRDYSFYGVDDFNNPVAFIVREHPQGGSLIYFEAKMEKTLIGSKMWTALHVIDNAVNGVSDV